MSVQFGKCNFDGKPIDPHDLEEARPVLAPYGPDSEGYICQGNFGVLYRAVHTTSESRRETQPHVSQSGAVITWDGRLDNRKDLIESLSGALSLDSTDIEIVAAAYERWGTDAFKQLIGDWALSAWDPSDQSLLLAKDFVGTRHLYYSVQEHRVAWCTILDPLVLLSRHQFKLQEEYVAGWLSFFPAPHLTPYVGIHAVPPSSFVRLERETQKIAKYWDFDPARRIRYRSDSEYEQHFRVVFSQAVGRRLRSDSPVLAELSGGIDSSSIVCVADEIVTREPSRSRPLETVSYYDDSEPNWDERLYFKIVEAKRANVGYHIDIARQELSPLAMEDSNFSATPKPVYRSQEAREEFAKCLKESGSRVVLCGIAGDEVTGGVPTAIPELQDLLAKAQVRRLANRLKVWALEKRKPWFHLFFEAVNGFLPFTLSTPSKIRRPVPWLGAGFLERNRHALLGYPSRLKVLGLLPSFQENISTLNALRRQLGCDVPSSEPLYEVRYPYLDRELLEFLFAIPREQLVRPGQRRSLMRRALAGIVPDEILNRKRKAYISRTPLAALSGQVSVITATARQMMTSSLGITDPNGFRETLHRVRDGQEDRIVHLLRTLELEAWLQLLIRHGIVRLAPAEQNERTEFVRSLRAHRDSAQQGRV
jgi:asparagine synthase (glutamine-hydrolysing)